MDRVQGVGGRLAHHRRPFGRRALLPYELDLCEQLGVTPDEYWEFIVAAQEYVAERGEEYELVPDVRGEITSTTLAIISLVVGVASTAISLLLRPKPAKAKDDRRANLEIGGREGRTRYSRATDFDGIQQLASLGKTIPLVFARRLTSLGEDYGGVRVETDMLFSQMISNGGGQLLYTLLSLGMSELGAQPDYDGIAIGDLLLRDFSPFKNRLFYGRSERLHGAHVYAQSKLWRNNDTTLEKYEDSADAFGVWSPGLQSFQTDFSGARTPSTATQFGAYSPLPNGHRFYAPMELILVMKKSGTDAKYAQRAKQAKVTTPFPRGAGVVDADDDNVTYGIFNLTREIYKEGNVSSPDNFDPNGIDDIQSTQDETRIAADESLQENQQFLVGSALAILTQRQKSDIWAKEDRRNRKFYLAIQEKFGQDMSDLVAIPNENSMRDLLDNNKDLGGAAPWKRPTVQLAAVASLTNSRPCHITEVGIRSEVWRQMRGAINYNSFPEKKVREEYEDEQANITIGSVTAYMRRYSFFRIYARELGAENWVNITDTRAIAVLGASPQQKYNTIRIESPSFGSYEYRFVPVPGAEFYKGNRLDEEVCLLDGRPLVDPDCHTYEKNGYHITITGELAGIQEDNTEWIFSTGDAGDRFDSEITGPIKSLEKYETNHTIPTEIKKGEPETRYSGSDTVKLAGGFAYENRAWIWNGAIYTSRDGTKIDERTIQIEHDRGKTFQYTEGRMVVEGNPGGESWNPFNKAEYDLGDNASDPSGYKYAVYYDTTLRRWRYIYNGILVVESLTATDGFIENHDSTKRYRRVEKKQEGSGSWKVETGKDEMYAKNADGTMKDGAIEDFQRSPDTVNICTFWVNGKIFARGTPAEPLVGYKSETVRYVAFRKAETDRELTPPEGWLHAEGGVRLTEGVTHGACSIRDKGTYRFFYNGQEVGEVKPDNNGAAMVTIPGGSKTFMLNGNQGKFVGVNNDVPCYAISIFQNAEYVIRKEVKSSGPEAWSIQMQDKEPGSPRYYEIVRTEIISERPQRPHVERGVSIRSLAEKDDDNQNLSAKATVEYWHDGTPQENPGKVRWTITDKGDNYTQGETVKIGRWHYYGQNDGSTAPKTTVKANQV